MTPLAQIGVGSYDLSLASTSKPPLASRPSGTQLPLTHMVVLPQLPHEWPQPSSPHCLVPHDGVHTGSHWPAAEQLLPVPQLPHEPPQPLSPHCLAPHEAVQFLTHSPCSLQVSSAAHSAGQRPYDTQGVNSCWPCAG